ncbi:MAG: hypothetical protein ACLQDM_25035 [Bradyrhizobium sp.]
MLLHLPIVFLASLPVTPVADNVPKFDIMRECRSEGGSQAMLDRCAAQEADARTQLQAEWIQFGADDRSLCFKETNMDGSPSYVEFLTCLEMARDAKKMSK